MNTTGIAVLIVVILAAGVYVAIGNLAQQYAVVPGNSNADQYACAAQESNIRVGQSTKFAASLPEGTQYYWSAPDATSSFTISGPLSAQYNRAGTKTAYLFYVIGDRWFRTSCTVLVK